MILSLTGKELNYANYFASQYFFILVTIFYIPNFRQAYHFSALNILYSTTAPYVFQ